MTPAKRILSGIRPTGKLHLGHYLGILENWKKLQDEAVCFYMIADLHALTTHYEETRNLQANIQDIVLDILAAGIDPDRCTLFLQSTLPEHSELSLLLSMITPLPWLYRNPTYKEMIQENRNSRDLLTHGFLGYPILMASDILLYRADTVPIGQDQLPHLEFAREIARRFNSIFDTQVLVEPQPSLTPQSKVVGLDGRKMSKSYDNCIYLADDAATVTKRVQQMITDPARIRRTDKGHPEVCTVHAYHRQFNTGESEAIDAACRNADLGCTDCKKRLAEVLNTFLAPIRERRLYLAGQGDTINRVLHDGTLKARSTTTETLRQVKSAMRLWC